MPKLNGSENLLGDAMRQVFSEAAGPPLSEDMRGMEKRRNTLVDGVKEDIEQVRGELTYARRQG